VIYTYSSSEVPTNSGCQYRYQSSMGETTDASTLTVTTNFSSPHATLLDGLSISLCRLEVPFCTFQSKKRTFFHVYALYKLDNKRICRFLHYNPRSSGLVLKIKNYIGFPCHVTRSMILDLPYTGNALTRPFSSI
jgi:hypothetical protein